MTGDSGVAFDIAPEPADGRIGFDDFFQFADFFGVTVSNAEEIRAALE